MIAADTNVWVDYFRGDVSDDLTWFDAFLKKNMIVMPPPVLTELLSAKNLQSELADTLKNIPRLSLQEGYWERAGELRRKILKKGLKARILDCLIAQLCLDSEVPLMTSDGDYRHFRKHAGLRIWTSE